MSATVRGIQVFDASRNAFGVFKGPSVLARLASQGIRVTTQVRDADIIVGETRAQLLRQFVRGRGLKPAFLYTNEPSFDWTATPAAWLVPGLKRLAVMNVFTGDVFTDPAAYLAYFGLEQPLPELPTEAILRPRFENGRIAAFLTWRPADAARRMVAGHDVDLNARRIALALAGHSRGNTDIFGKGFPPGVAKDSTGWGATAPGEEWWDVKHRMLITTYAINLCAENTDWPNYITEKIWQSIRAHCLPVYFGRNNGIRALFPANSYVEIADYPGPAALFDFLASLAFDEFTARLEKCRDTYASLIARYQAGLTDTPAKRIDRLARRLRLCVVKSS